MKIIKKSCNNQSHLYFITFLSNDQRSKSNLPQKTVLIFSLLLILQGRLKVRLILQLLPLYIKHILIYLVKKKLCIIFPIWNDDDPFSIDL